MNFPDIFCIFNEVKRCIFVFCEFLDDVRFLENRNNIFEENSLKAFLRQSFRVFDFSNLSSDSRYLESVTLKETPRGRMSSIVKPLSAITESPFEKGRFKNPFCSTISLSVMHPV